MVTGGDAGTAGRVRALPGRARGRSAYARDKCVAASISLLFKRRGESAPGEGSVRPMIRVGKRDPGRFLDSRTWDEMSTVSRAG
jgi:hypothetical protein